MLQNPMQTYMKTIRTKGGYVTFTGDNPIHDKAIHMSIPEGEPGSDLPVYCLDANNTSHKGVKHIFNMSTSSYDGSFAWYYTPEGARKIVNGKQDGDTVTGDGMYGHYSVTQIMQMQYIVGAGEPSGKALSRDNWKLSKQIAIWLVAMNGKEYWYKGNGTYYFTANSTNINYFAEKFGLNDSEKADVRNNTLDLYNSAVKYAYAMQNYGTMEKSPSISTAGSASIYSTGDSTYKIGPFKLDYSTSSVRTIEGLEVTGDAGKVTLDSNYYEYSTGSRGTTLPTPGTSFYIHVKNLGSTSKITKVSIKYKYESYAKVDLYDAITEGSTYATQPVLLAERSTL